MPLTTFLVKKEFSLHRPVLIFQPTVNSWASDNQSTQCHNTTVLLTWEKCAVTKYLRIYRCVWRGLGGGGGTFWLLNVSPTFKGPEALQATAVNQLGVNKICPNFNTLFVTTL